MASPMTSIQVATLFAFRELVEPSADRTDPENPVPFHMEAPCVLTPEHEEQLVKGEVPDRFREAVKALWNFAGPTARYRAPDEPLLVPQNCEWQQAHRAGMGGVTVWVERRADCAVYRVVMQGVKAA